MSTGADCRVYEKERGKWYYRIQRYPYGSTSEYDTIGPFTTFREAMNDLDYAHGNPGAYFIEALPGCPHDLARDERFLGDERPRWVCDRCGRTGKEVEAAAKRPHEDRTVWHQADGWYYGFISKNPLASGRSSFGPYLDQFTAQQFLKSQIEAEDHFYPQVKELRKALKGTRTRKRSKR